jgi:heat shock protein HslJ
MRRTVGFLLGAALVVSGACSQHEQGAPTSEPEPPIVGTLWQWQEFQDSADGEEARHIRVAEPSAYTLTLAPEGKALIQADCNLVRWTYALDGSRFGFDTLGPGTLAYCGDDAGNLVFVAAATSD